MNNLLQVGKLYKLTNSDSVFLVISDTNQKVEFVFRIVAPTTPPSVITPSSQQQLLHIQNVDVV